MKQAIQERATELSGEGQWQKAARLLETLMIGRELPDFLTLASSELLD